MPYKMDISDLYQDPILIPLDRIPFIEPADHTMDIALGPYVDKKMPAKELSEGIANNLPIRVMGIFDPHFKKYCEVKGWISEPYKKRKRTSRKRFNFERPKLYRVTEPKGVESLVFTVMPGWEYVRQYGWLVRQYMDKYQNGSSEKLLEVTYFPETCKSLAIWSDLINDSQIRSGDIVILGYVDEFADMLIKHGFDKIDFYYDPDKSIYGRHILSNRMDQRVLLLGVTYSYWGSIVGRIAEALYEKGACEIIYAAKCGTLADPKDIYNQLVIPRFYALYSDGKFEFIRNEGNILRDINVPKMTGLHVSVPTVVGESYVQREDLHRLGATSIDDEISHIAKAAVAIDGGTGTKVKFASMHFSTDYVRRKSERGLQTDHDLSTGGTSIARELKRKILYNIGENLYAYLFRTKCDGVITTRPAIEEIRKLQLELPRITLPDLSIGQVIEEPERQWIDVEDE